MTFTKNWFRAHIVALSLASALTLTGCVSAVVDGAIRGAVEALPPGVQEFIAQNSDLSLEMPISTEVPNDWPQPVSIPDGEVVFSYADADLWSLALSVADEQAALSGAERLQANGFGVVREQDIQQMSLLELTDGEWDVDYAWIADGDTVVVNVTVRASG
jgi:hypothetical protein